MLLSQSFLSTLLLASQCPPRQTTKTTRYYRITMFAVTLLVAMATLVLHGGNNGVNHLRRSLAKTVEPDKFAAMIQSLEQAGYSVCRHRGQVHNIDNDSIPFCYNPESFDRLLLEEEQGPQNWTSMAWNLAAVLVCVTTAAMAAGLTLGLLGLDPLVLLIKERAGATEKERSMASQLLPVLQQHHRLLVTLLLLNAASNEALPIFLESLVSPTVAIILSVTLVLFFGEIIPSAIFTGPDQLKLAHGMLPLVRIALALLYPLAGPIAALLDRLLHHEDEDDNGGYNRGELAALIRIQYEERLAWKRKRKSAQQVAVRPLVISERAAQDNKQAITRPSDHLGALDFSSALLPMDARKSLRATKSQLEHEQKRNNDVFSPRDDGMARAPSIRLDEVVMAEAALHLHTRVAIDVYTALHKVVSIPHDMILNERNMVKIYASGFTRMPVYKAPEKSAICGLLLTKQLIVVNAKDERAVDTLPLRRPHCVSPEMPLTLLINLLQTGGSALQGGHMALVCARPHIGNQALEKGLEVPESAGLMGIITLEDVLEALLQEQIYDEMDKKEREATRLARMVCQQWKRYVRRKKAGRMLSTPLASEEPALVHVVEQAVEKSEADEGTPLITIKKRKTPKGVFSWFNDTPPKA